MGLTNNDIFKKLRVAHKLTNDDIVEICMLVGYKVSKSELGAIFRREGHPKYMECGDQLLRNFLDGLIVHKRGHMPPKKKPFKKNYQSKPRNNPKFKHKGNHQRNPRFTKKD